MLFFETWGNLFEQVGQPLMTWPFCTFSDLISYQPSPCFLFSSHNDFLALCRMHQGLPALGSLYLLLRALLLPCFSSRSLFSWVPHFILALLSMFLKSEFYHSMLLCSFFLYMIHNVAFPPLSFLMSLGFFQLLFFFLPPGCGQVSTSSKPLW